jgi:hypothetical protein
LTQTSNIKETPNKTVILPHYKGLSEQIHRIMKKYGYRIAYRGENKLKTKLKLNQQKTFDSNNVVYRITCKDCNAIYIYRRNYERIENQT